MKLKPKNTVLLDRALLYKRFTSIETSYNYENVYKTLTDNKYWLFNAETLNFVEVFDIVDTNYKITSISDITQILQYQTNYFRYGENGWEKVNLLDDNISILSAKFNNVGKYQMNKYYYVGSFDYMLRGSIEGTTTQYLKGNIMPLTSLNIKHYNDDIILNVDDLVVLDKHLFSVENIEEDRKFLPKEYKVYFATLNNIL